MADDKLPDSPDESNESTPTDPTGAELAGDEFSQRASVEPESVETPAELTEDAEIVDPEDTPDDPYVDDPSTYDINEAKLDRATDEVAAEETVEPGSTAQRRPRSNRPVRRPAGSVPEPVSDPDPQDPRGAEGPADEAVSERVPARAGGRTRSSAPVRKARPSQTDDSDRRTTPALFVKQSVGELRKVVWPTGNQVQQYFIVVLVFVLFIMTFVSLLDLGFGWAVLRLFGG